MVDSLHRRRPGALLWLLIAATLFVRAFVPAGWMADAAERGGFVIELCNSDAQIVIPVPSKESGDAGDHGKSAPCAFAGINADYAPPPAFATIAAILSAAQSHHAARARTLALVRAAVRPPSRGPPLTV